ncbi:MAG TPA: hypothetical protein VGJ78_22975 [Vicinamibacterales bacterium]|jgi:hypothetical protein
MKRAAVTTVVIAAATLQAAAAAAQSHIEAVPSVTVGSLYDDNLFAQSQGDAGHMITLRPGLGTAVDTPRLNLSSLFTFDSQHSNHADLTMIDARRHADAKVNYRASEAATLGVMAQYDRTETPGEINIGTGILSDRRQAQRWEAQPNFSYRFRPHTSITGSYDFMAESLVDNGTGRMQVVRAGLSQIASARSTFSGLVQERHFADPTDATNGSDSVAALGGWDHQFSPASRFSLQAGPRVSSYRGLQPEVNATIQRETPRLKAGLDYAHSETIVLGIRGPVAYNGGGARVTWGFRRTMEVSSHTAATRIDTLDEHRLTSYRQTFIGSWTPGGLYTFNASYGVDYQQGNVRRGVFTDADVWRHVFGVSVTVAPRYSRSTKGPDDPAARAKGVSK